MSFIAILIAALAVLCLSDRADAWGLATHVEFADIVVRELATLSTGAAALILANRREYLRGNLFADLILGKQFSRRRRRAHHWHAGRRLLANANDDHGKAFAYGYLSHLAADTVAHNTFVPDLVRQTGSTRTLGHFYWEMRADLMVDPEHRGTVRHLLKNSHPVNETLLAGSVFPEMRWYGLNRGLFIGVNNIAHGKKFRSAVSFCHDLSQWRLSENRFEEYRVEAVSRMLEIIANNGRGRLETIDPNGRTALAELRGRN